MLISIRNQQSEIRNPLSCPQSTGSITLRRMALFSIDTNGQLEPHIHQEWLLTNGSGRVLLFHCRRCPTPVDTTGSSCGNPPAGRADHDRQPVAEALILDDKADNLLELSVNQFRDRFHPLGDRYLRKFELNDVARWEYSVEGVQVFKELQFALDAERGDVRYTVILVKSDPFNSASSLS